MNKILITGGTGFIGYNLAIKLSENYEITVFDNNFKNSQRSFKKFKRIKFIRGDIRNIALLKKIIIDIDIVIHLAFINGTELFYSRPDLVLEVGVLGTINIIKSINETKNKVKKFIYFSSSEIYNEPNKIPTPEEISAVIPNVKNPRFSYASSKLLGEVMTLHLLKKNIKKNIIRPHNIYGPNMGNLHAIPEIVLKIKKKFNKNDKTKKIILKIQGSGNETRAFCYIDDAIDGIIRVLKKGKNNEIYNVGTNQEISIKELIEKIGYLLNLKIIIKTSKIKSGSAMRRNPNINKIKKLGYKSKFSISSGLKRTIAYYLNDIKS